MFSDSNLTHDTDLSKLTELVNSKRIYSGQNLGKYALEQKNNYKKRVAAASNLAEDGGPILSKYDFDDYRISSEYERKVNAMDPASRAKIIKNLSTEKFFKSNAQLLHNLSDRNYVKGSFPASADVYSDTDLDRVHSLWTPKNKFETFLKLKKRDMEPSKLLTTTLGLDGKPLLANVNENKGRNMALIKPIPNPLEVFKDIEGNVKPIPAVRPKKVFIPPNITQVYDPVEFPDEFPLIDLRDDVRREPESPLIDFPEIPSHIPVHPPSFYDVNVDVESEEDIAKRRENKNYNRILKKLRTAPTPPGDSPHVSADEDEEEVEEVVDSVMGEK